MLTGTGVLWRKIKEVMAPATKTSTFTSAAIDMANYKGIVAFVVHLANGTGNADNTATPSLQDCATSGGSYAALATQPAWVKGSDLATAFPAILGSGANPGPIVCFLDTRKCREFVELVLTLAGTNPSFVGSAAAYYLEEYPS